MCTCTSASTPGGPAFDCWRIPCTGGDRQTTGLQYQAQANIMAKCRASWSRQWPPTGRPSTTSPSFLKPTTTWAMRCGKLASHPCTPEPVLANDKPQGISHVGICRKCLLEFKEAARPAALSEPCMLGLLQAPQAMLVQLQFRAPLQQAAGRGMHDDRACLSSRSSTVLC